MRVRMARSCRSLSSRESSGNSEHVAGSTPSASVSMRPTRRWAAAASPTSDELVEPLDRHHHRAGSLRVRRRASACCGWSASAARTCGRCRRRRRCRRHGGRASARHAAASTFGGAASIGGGCSARTRRRARARGVRGSSTSSPPTDAQIIDAEPVDGRQQRVDDGRVGATDPHAARPSSSSSSWATRPTSSKPTTAAEPFRVWTSRKIGRSGRRSPTASSSSSRS